MDKFIHKLYINVARKVYLNIYLFETDIPALNIQKNNRELELIIKEVILNTIRDNIPVENILKAYLDETEEMDTVVEEKRETVVDNDAVEQARLLREKELERERDQAKIDALTLERESDKLSIGDIVKQEQDKQEQDKQEQDKQEQDKQGQPSVNFASSGPLNLAESIDRNASLDPENTIVSNNQAVKPTDENSIKIDTEEMNIDSLSLEIQDLNSVGIEPEIDLGIEEL